jgi:hypothetical protein
MNTFTVSKARRPSTLRFTTQPSIECALSNNHCDTPSCLVGSTATAQPKPSMFGDNSQRPMITGDLHEFCDPARYFRTFQLDPALAPPIGTKR